MTYPDGTYLLQSLKMKYNIDSVKEAMCPLCCLEDEDLEHMLLRCPTLSSIRSHHLTELKRYLQQKLGLHIWSEHFRDRNVIVQLLIDCRSLVPNIIPDKTDIILAVETHTRHFCYKLHLKRLYLHKHLKDDSGDNMASNPTC